MRMLMQNRDGFDIFLGGVSKAMDIPVIVTSIADQAPATIRCIFHAFCDYLVNRNKKEVFRDLWRHDRQRRKCTSEDMAQTGDPGNGNKRRLEAFENSDIASFESEEKLKEEKEATPTTRLLKKPRVAWDRSLHERFVWAVNQLGGVNKAVPKRILEIMNIPGLTRDNVASHLQKYRDQVRRGKKAKESRENIVLQPPPPPLQPPPPPLPLDFPVSSYSAIQSEDSSFDYNISEMGHEEQELGNIPNGFEPKNIILHAPPPLPPPPPPLPLDFPVSSYSAIRSEDSSFDYNISDMGHKEWELGNILDGFEPQNIILQAPRPPPLPLPPPPLPLDFPVSSYSAIPSEESSFDYSISEMGHEGWELGNILDGFEPENIILQPPPPPLLQLDFPVNSYSAIQSEEHSFDYNILEMGHEDWELTSIFEGFQPGSIIPRHPPGNSISGQSAIPDQEKREGTGIYED